MATVLVVFPGARAFQGSIVPTSRYTVHLVEDAAPVIRDAADHAYDLLVLGGMPIDAQQRVAARLLEHRRWRPVPILYVLDPATPGMVVPATYRPELDSIVQGELSEQTVQRKIRALVREGIATTDLVVAGPVELDQLRCRLNCGRVQVDLTALETEILAFLMARPNRTVAAAEIISACWGVEPDTRHLQILRRHVSNIRRKLDPTPAARAVRTSRGAGYRFDVRLVDIAVPA